MATRKAHMRADTFNLLVAAGVLVLVALAAVVLMLWVTPASCGEEDRRAETNQTGPGDETQVAYRYTDVRQGPFVSPTAADPWRREEVASVAAQVISPVSLYDREAPYLTAKPSVRARAEVLCALAELARGMPVTEGVSLLLMRGYLTWEAAGEMAGRSPYHTGYTVQIALSVEGTVMSIGEALKHPVAASPAAWLNVNLTAYGFVREAGEGDGSLRYVGHPHAAVMTARGLSVSGYCSWVATLREASPHTITRGRETICIFYLPADYGIASLTMSANTAVYVVGDGVSGYLVATRRVDAVAPSEMPGDVTVRS